MTEEEQQQAEQHAGEVWTVDQRRIGRERGDDE